jgi:hypothetical protein
LFSKLTDQISFQIIRFSYKLFSKLSGTLFQFFSYAMTQTNLTGPHSKFIPNYRGPHSGKIYSRCLQYLVFKITFFSLKVQYVYQKWPVLRFIRQASNATTPTRGLAEAAGFDLYSACDAVVPARGTALISTDLQVRLPDGCYRRIATLIRPGPTPSHRCRSRCGGCRLPWRSVSSFFQPF